MPNYSKVYYIAMVRKTISNNEILNHLRKICYVIAIYI